MVDTNGDFIPDGVIVAGPDGTLGVDTNGDGIPDLPAGGSIATNVHAVDTDGNGTLDGLELA